jgi:hypothetical protein
VCQIAIDKNQPLFFPSRKDGSHRALSFPIVPSSSMRCRRADPFPPKNLVNRWTYG